MNMTQLLEKVSPVLMVLGALGGILLVSQILARLCQMILQWFRRRTYVGDWAAEEVLINIAIAKNGTHWTAKRSVTAVSLIKDLDGFEIGSQPHNAINAQFEVFPRESFVFDPVKSPTNISKYRIKPRNTTIVKGRPFKFILCEVVEKAPDNDTRGDCVTFRSCRQIKKLTLSVSFENAPKFVQYTVSDFSDRPLDESFIQNIDGCYSMEFKDLKPNHVYALVWEY